MKRAVDNSVPVLDGEFLANISRTEMEKLFDGNIELPMLDEKRNILHQVGHALTQRYARRFHNFYCSCPPRLFDGGKGLVERLVEEFPRFRDVSPYHGHVIKFYKLSQLTIFFLYTTLRKNGRFEVQDLETMSAFADYVVPLALRLLGIITYSTGLERLTHVSRSHMIARRKSRFARTASTRPLCCARRSTRSGRPIA